MRPSATLSKHLPDLPPPAWIRWLPFWHGLVYLLTAGVTLLALIDVQSWQTRLLLVPGLLLWAGWYSVCVRVKLSWWGRHMLLVCAYLAAGWLLWIVLSWLDVFCSLLLFALYTQIFLFIALPWKILLALTLAVLHLGAEVLSSGGWDPIFLVILAVSLTCIAFAFFVSSIIKQSYAQRRLISELEEKSQALAREQRRAGMIEERQRLAYEIHDTLAQDFTSIVMHLEAADALLPNAAERAQGHLDQARRMARENLAEARRLMWALQPEGRDRAPLSEVLSALTDQWARESGLEAGAIVTGYPCPLRPEYEHTLLRAAQEALTNVRKHARATQATVTLSYLDDLVTLDVQDDGMGFVWEEVQHTALSPDHVSGFGLKSLRERVERLGGTLIVESARDEGTTIAIALPACPAEREERG